MTLYPSRDLLRKAGMSSVTSCLCPDHLVHSILVFHTRGAFWGVQGQIRGTEGFQRLQPAQGSWKASKALGYILG